MLVDEASMMDVKMGQALLEALPRGCRLVLVGEYNHSIFHIFPVLRQGVPKESIYGHPLI